MKKIINLKKILNSKSGSTMVELLCSFTVVMIISAMFLGVVTLSINMVKKSKDIREETNNLMKEYYINGEKGGLESDPNLDTLVLTDGQNSFDFNVGIYSYSVNNGKQKLYSFGKHDTIIEEETNGN